MAKILEVSRSVTNGKTPNAGSMAMPSTPTVIAIVASTALIYISWSNLPDWARVFKKRDIADTDKDANDDLENPYAIVNKLKEMMALVSAVSDEVTPDQLTSWQMIAAFYSLIHLNTELHVVDPDHRDKQYDNDRKDDDVKLAELQELKTVLDYADWAYECSYVAISNNCRKAGLDLMRHDTATEPGRVGHFIAFDHKNKTAIVALKGTSTLADALTDLVAVPKEHCCYFDDETFPASSGKSIYCHEGIHTAAMWMADDLQDFVENVIVPLKYKLLITGHSLGAGTSCLLGLELRARIPAFRKNFTDLRVLAFATPPVVGYEASKACAPFITSVINNCDVVTRASLSNFVVMNKMVITANEKLQAKGHAFDTWSSLKNYYDKEVATVDTDLLMTGKEIDEWFDATHAAPEKVPDHLYIPGRCVVMWDKGANGSNEIGGIATDCGMKMLRQIELSSTMVTDHFVTGYRDNMTKLIEQLESK